MKNNEIKKHIGLFILGVLLIAVYKTFDSLGQILEYIGNFLSLFTPIVCAFVIAFVLYPLCVKIEAGIGRTKISFFSKHRRGFAVLAIYALFFAVIGAFGAFIIPAIIQSVSDFFKQLPSIAVNVQKFLSKLTIADYTFDSLINKISITSLLAKYRLDDIQLYLNRVMRASQFIISMFFSIIISVYILLDRAGLMRTVRRVGDLIFPDTSKNVIMKYINRTFSIMYKYIYCQLADACIVFVLAFALLVVMRIKYAPVLALLLGIFNLIPYFGAITATVIAALLTAFTSSISMGIWVAVSLTVLQQIDANIIQPKLVRNALEVKPFWVLCGISVGGGLFGMLGIILAVPVMALVKTLFDDYYEYAESKNAENTENAEN